MVVELEAVAGEPLVTADMARRAGFILVPVAGDGTGRLAQDMAHLGSKVGETFAGYAEAIGDDGRVDAAEAEGIERDLAEIIRVTTRALDTVRQVRA